MLIKGLFWSHSVYSRLLVLITLERKGGRPVLPANALIPVMLISFLGGLITGWVAIGEGEIIAAFCMLAYGLDANRAIGLGVVLLSINSILLAFIHSFYSAAFPGSWRHSRCWCVMGGRLGPFLAQWISMHTTKKVFAFIALLDGMVIILQTSYVMFFGKGLLNFKLHQTIPICLNRVI